MNVNDGREVNAALPEPAAEMVVTEVDQLKALSDPLRLELLNVMGLEPRRGWTARELAERLDTKQTRLYHHLSVLEEGGFIRVPETRVVSGIIERRYQVAAHAFRVNRGLLAGGGAEVATEMLDAVFDRTRNDILASIRAGRIEIGTDAPRRRRLQLSASAVRLSPASVRKVQRLVERLAEVDALEDPGGDEYGLIVSFYPRSAESDR